MKITFSRVELDPFGHNRYIRIFVDGQEMGYLNNNSINGRDWDGWELRSECAKFWHLLLKVLRCEGKTNIRLGKSPVIAQGKISDLLEKHCPPEAVTNKHIIRCFDHKIDEWYPMTGTSHKYSVMVKRTYPLDYEDMLRDYADEQKKGDA